jgi:aquaporin Z
MDIGIFLGELLGTFILVLSILATANPLYITAAFLASITIISKLSGGHINPAVTLAMYMNGTLTKNQALGYIPGQLAGAVVAYYAYKAYYKGINASS